MRPCRRAAAASTARPRGPRRPAPAARSSAPTTRAAPDRRARNSRRGRPARAAPAPGRPQRTCSTPCPACASCHATIWSRASSSAARRPGSRRSSAASISARATARVVDPAAVEALGVARGPRRRPRARTSAMIAATAGPTSAPAAAGRASARTHVGGTAEIDTSQHGERLIVPAGPSRRPRIRPANSGRRTSRVPCWRREHQQRPRPLVEHRHAARRARPPDHRDGRALRRHPRLRAVAASCSAPSAGCSPRAAPSTAPAAYLAMSEALAELPGRRADAGETRTRRSAACGRRTPGGRAR